jgi:hypothetical protein
VLGIKDSENRTSSANANDRVARIASLALANAMIFQEVLAASDTRVNGLRKVLEVEDFLGFLVSEWKKIIDVIDYVPIFKIGHEILVNLSVGPGVDHSLRKMTEIALLITTKRAALRHDLMGRIYHLLLADAKYMGAFYTMVPSATLLLRLALFSNYWSIDWSNISELSNLRIADLACGTGTLLKAALQFVIDNYIVSAVENNKPIELLQLNKALVQDVLVGLDVLPFASHLTATTLALHSPEVSFTKIQIYNLPINAPSLDSTRLGSTDLLRKKMAMVQTDLFGGIQGPERITATGDLMEALSVEDLDLCVMNPHLRGA